MMITEQTCDFSEGNNDEILLISKLNPTLKSVIERYTS